MYSETSVNEINVNEVQVIDVREKYEYDSGHVKNSINIPFMAIISNPSDYLEKNKKYYIICYSGSRSKRACDILSNQGYKVINVFDGYCSYRA